MSKANLKWSKITNHKYFHNDLNYNVKIVFLFTILQSTGRGIWMGNVLSAYIYLIAEESNVVLGLTGAATGIAMTLVVFPAGYMSDRFHRDWILRAASVLGFISLFFLAIANNIYLIVVALLFWGTFQGLSRPALESIFADSVISGKRSQIYSWNHFARQASMAIGPFINVGLFLILGDKWDIIILKTVMLVGILISCMALVVGIFFKDAKSLGDSSESLPTANGLMEEKAVAVSDHTQKRMDLFVPIVLGTCNFIIGFGAGMTVKFFPIFFMKQYDLLPISVQIIMGLTLIVTGMSSVFTQRVSQVFGRPQMIFIVQSLSISCLIGIAFYPAIWILLPIFIMRGALMNSSQPLSRAILMDVIPKRHRGKFNSLQAVAWGFFWNFSAVIGGFLIGDNNNYRLCFLITAGLYIIGTLPILLLIPKVPKEVEQVSKEHKKIVPALSG